MNRAIATSAIGASVILAATGIAWWMRRGAEAVPALPPTVIPMVSPVITVEIAEQVLSHMEHLPPDEVTLVLHTDGGEVTACVLIADALRKFKQSTAIVPYMAFSGGTLIALNATRLQLGKNAALSAVDPVIAGQRARHIPKNDEKNASPLHPLAQEYDSAVRDYLSESLKARLGAEIGPAALERAMTVFMGLKAPHSWPIHAAQLHSLGIPVDPADVMWSRIVDELRRASPRQYIVFGAQSPETRRALP
jgi:hypothetical protein